MKIALIDSFPDTSHLKWAKGFQKYSRHDIDLIFGEPYHWKWQMTGGTYNLIQQLHSRSIQYDMFIVTDMVNLPIFKSHLSPKDFDVPVVMYFHENQITYPWSPKDQDPKMERDYHYGWINYSSARLSDYIFYNSEYHYTSFLNALPEFVGKFPKFSYRKSIEEIINKSEVLYLGVELPEYRNRNNIRPIFLWNHRWEYDKNPELFFNTLIHFSELGFDFGLIVLGKSKSRTPEIFSIAKEKLRNHILHWGWAPISNYNSLINQSNVLLVTSNQDYFGISVVEAIAAGVVPILPKRLSYPEHIPEHLHSKVFYESEDGLLKLLKEIIFSERKVFNNVYSRYVQKYDWKQVVSQYDDQMELILEKWEKKRSG